ncbi:hypothetical protein J3E69DRAFT_93569 [Trichoderma sp. SZMC 28015]
MTHPTDSNGCFITQLYSTRPWNVLVHVHVPRPANARRAHGRGQKAQSPARVTFHVPSAGEKQDQYDTKQMQLVPVPGGNLAYR